MELIDRARAAFDRVIEASGNRILEPFEAYAHQMVLAGSHWFSSSPHEIPASSTTNVTNKGEDNFVFIGYGATLPRVVRFRGTGHVIAIGAFSDVTDAIFDVLPNDSLTYIGAFTVLKSFSAVFARPPATVVIGDHCYIGERVQASGSDQHGIYNINSRQRINPNRDILVGDGAFIGADSRLNKGVVVEPGGIVLGGSIVTGTIRSRCAYHGVPARLVHEDVAWAPDADQFETLDEAIAQHEAATAVKLAELQDRISSVSGKAVA